MKTRIYATPAVKGLNVLSLSVDHRVYIIFYYDNRIEVRSLCIEVHCNYVLVYRIILCIDTLCVHINTPL